MEAQSPSSPRLTFIKEDRMDVGGDIHNQNHHTVRIAKYQYVRDPDKTVMKFPCLVLYRPSSGVNVDEDLITRQPG